MAARRLSFCWWCKRQIRTDEDYRFVTVELRRAVVCERCWTRVEPDVPVDYTVLKLYADELLGGGDDD